MNVNLPPPVQRRNNQSDQVMRRDLFQERPVQSQAETTQRGTNPRQRGINDGILQRQSGGNNGTANQLSGRNVVQSQNTAENRRTGGQGVQQTANRRNSSTVNNDGRDPRVANRVRPISTEASNNPIFFSGFGRQSIQDRPVNCGSRLLSVCSDNARLSRGKLIIYFGWMNRSMVVDFS